MSGSAVGVAAGTGIGIGTGIIREGEIVVHLHRFQRLLQNWMNLHES